MKYNVGNKVRIKSIDWYNKNKDEDGIVELSTRDFIPEMVEHCGTVVTIKDVFEDIDDNVVYYCMEDIIWDWTDEMIEGLAEEENKPKFKVGDEVRIKGTDIGGTIESVIRGQLIVNSKGSKIPAWPEDVVLMKSVEEENKPNIIEEAKTYWDSIKDAWICPEGYIFKDENDNVINATKIVLEKKKKEYPKTYVECWYELKHDINHDKVEGYKSDILSALQKLLICRDAYWKIAGEEMGLGKPWKPDYNGTFEHGTPIKYVIYNIGTHIVKERKSSPNHILSFPTAEMRDAFKENFDPDIEICKKFL